MRTRRTRELGWGAGMCRQLATGGGVSLRAKSERTSQSVLTPREEVVERGVHVGMRVGGRRETQEGKEETGAFDSAHC
ncbi:hypothetical protein FQA47_007412 [Oryzias melastigma]|uniref:Uncharacterized protein n=1 Tax=Oryzias melastigma TaxID=30732 RepID=A0A834CHE9_ORYME|nr:hypothetical protein FQA47_007412 [Oryzias melastigma]